MPLLPPVPGLVVRRTFVGLWITLGVAGALDHTIAEKLVGRRFDLWLPQLKYGFVMFNINPRIATVYEYAGPDGQRHDLADLVVTPAPGYARARLAIDATSEPQVLSEVCYRAVRRTGQEFDVFVSEYEVEPGQSRPSKTTALHCDVHGLIPR